MKTYEQEFKELLNKVQEKEMKIREKYKGIFFNQLDESLEGKEIKELTKWYKEELEKLKEKYSTK